MHTWVSYSSENVGASMCARFSSSLCSAGWPKSLDKLVKGRLCHGYGCSERDALIGDS